jgi:hypothetical protein
LPKQKRKKKQKKLAQEESNGQLVIRLKKASSARPTDAVEEEGRPGGTTEVLEPKPVHSAEDPQKSF